MKDYYQALGVGHNASQDDIKKAFRAKAKESHPDAVPPAEKKDAEEKFKLISEAYDVLGDEDSRRKYDASSWRVSQVSFADIFGARPSKGPDIRGTMEVQLEDVVYGAKRTISLRRMASCKCVNGSADGKLSVCLACGGVGVVAREFGFGPMRMSTHAPCAACNGSGSTPVNPCGACHGTGHALVDDSIEIDIPVGTRDGDAMMIPGKGAWGPLGDGNLVIVLRVLPHGRFERAGDDLVSTIKVPFLTALGGGEALLEGLRGEKITVKVPRPCQHGQEVVMPGAGLRAGALRVRIMFDIPHIKDDDLARMSSVLV